jgi:hypothetical protein
VWPKDKVTRELEMADEKYRGELSNLPLEQAKIVLLSLIIYIAVMAGLYGLGWSIGWIRRGFKKPA